MKSDIQSSLESITKNVESSVTFEKVWSQYKQEEATSKRSLSQYLRWGAASVAIGALGVTGAGLGLAVFSPGVALAMDKAPIVNQVYNWFGDPGLDRVATMGNDVHIATTDHGITFTVTNVYDDTGRVVLQYRINSSNGTLKGQLPVGPNMDFYENGQKLNVASGGGTGLVSSQTWNGVNEIFPAATNVALPKQFDLQIVMHQIGNTRGYWEVQVPVSSEQTSANTKTYTPNISKTSDGITLTINQVTVTPASVLVAYTAQYKVGQNVDLLLNAKAGETTMIPDGGGAAHKSINGDTETVTSFFLYDKPANLGNTIEIEPQNNPIPPRGATTSQSIQLPTLNMVVALNN